MPRRKTVQPLPLQIIENDEFLIKARDRFNALIGRGLHARDDFNKTLHETLDLILPEAFIETSDAILHLGNAPRSILWIFWSCKNRCQPTIPGMPLCAIQSEKTRERERIAIFIWQPLPRTVRHRIEQ